MFYGEIRITLDEPTNTNLIGFGHLSFVICVSNRMLSCLQLKLILLNSEGAGLLVNHVTK